MDKGSTHANTHLEQGKALCIVPVTLFPVTLCQEQAGLRSNRNPEHNKEKKIKTLSRIINTINLVSQ